MKKIFLAALTAMALCSYSYAQDDDDYEDEDEAPAASQSSAPAASQPSSAAPASASAGGEMFGFGLSLTDALDNNGVQKFYLTYRLGTMDISAIFGLYHHGETTRETKNPSGEVDRNDDYTQIQIGVGFDMIIAQLLLPITAGGEFIFSHWGEDNNQVTINVLAGFNANLVSHLYLNGKVGLGFDYIDEPVEGSNGNQDDSRLDIGLKTNVMLSWFFI